MTTLLHRKALHPSCLHLVAGLVVAALAISVLSAQAESFLCSFVDTKGKPLRKVEVRLTLFGSSGLPQGTLYGQSNKKGVAEFKDLAAAPSVTYQIDARLKNYAPLTVAVDPAMQAAVTRTLLKQKEFDQQEKNANRVLEQGQYNEAIEAFKRLISA